MRKKISWKIEKRKLDQLNPYEHNPRKLTDKGMADLKRSIDKFGLAEPIIINQDNTIIGGHARYFTLLKMDNITSIDCYVPDRMLTPKEVQELNIRLNKNIAGEFDFDILANEFELPDLLEWGFEEKELDLNLWSDKTDEQLDDVPEPQKKAISKTGDIFLLDGKHRVMCGDSTKEADVSALMGEILADMIFTDPPYNVDYEGKTKLKLKIKNDVQENDVFRNFLNTSFQNLSKFTKPGGAIYMPHSDSEGYNFRGAFQSAGFLLKQCIIWNKNSMVMGRQDYHWKHEPILYGWRDGNSHQYFGNRNQTTVWDFDRPNRSAEHPTMKPVGLIVNAIVNSSLKNHIVLDLFLGSGSTLIACEQTNRICYGMEIDPIYIDVILRRYYNLYPDKKIECLTRNDFNLSDLFNAKN